MPAEVHPNTSAGVQSILQFFGILAIVWSVISFLFATGFVFRIDPAIFSILSITDILGISVSYAVYLIPFIVVLMAVPLQFMLPVPVKSGSGFKIEALPLHILLKISKNHLSISVLIIVILIQSFGFLDEKYHLSDRSSLFYQMRDVFLMGLSTFLIICAPTGLLDWKSRQTRDFILLGSLSCILVAAFLAGNYASSVRMNTIGVFDCAYIKDEKKCLPLLITGSKYSITWQSNAIIALKSDDISRIWLHPRKEPDKRVEP
jgi:hypothetical protein